MNEDMTVRPVRAEEAVEAARLNLRVAYELMEPPVSLEEYAADWEARGVLRDMEDVQANFFENGGAFLVVETGGKIAGTGAIQRHAEGVCIVRHVALLPEYRGRGWGYALMLELLRIAREKGYHTARLWTDRYKLARAIAFYHQMGFVNVEQENAYENELWMEMEIDP
jgi:N-acetylglutamate synthase-like GNAT family acetyltransferase